MVKERETYTATKGVENEGYEFEIGMLSFYCFLLCYHETITDFKIAIYDDQYHPFDDIVLEITTDITEKYAIQLKHVKDNLLLNSTHFGKNGKMILNKYFKYDFSKSDHVVLLTNGTVNEEITVGDNHLKIKSSLTPMEKLLDTCPEEENHVYEICNEENPNRITFFTSQQSTNDIEERIRQKFKQQFLMEDGVEGVVHKFQNFLQQWKKRSFELCKLDKEDIKMKITEILFYDHVVCNYQFNRAPHPKMSVLQEVMKSYDVTLIQDTAEDSLRYLCSFDFDKEDLVEDGRKMLIIANDNSTKEFSFILWRIQKFPLLLKVTNTNRKMILEVVKTLREENLSFVLIGNVIKEDLQVGTIFENLQDLKQNFEILQEFKISIQGREAITLEDLIGVNPNFAKIITMRELLLMAENNFSVGETEKDLPQPYIPRKLLTTTIKIKSLEQFPNDLFAISGPYKILKERLPKCKFFSFTDLAKKVSLGQKLPSRSVVLCGENAKFCFGTCLKYKNSNVHCLKLIDNDHLQLVLSKQKSNSLKQCQIISEDCLHDVSNKINLVCGGPGMGKWTLLQYLNKTCSPGYWTVKIDLQEEQNLQKFCQNDFASKMKKCFEKARRVIFFFYRIDHLQKEAFDNATQLIKKLANDNFKIWIFSENRLQESLEKLFEIRAMTLEEFSEEEQHLYIRERLKGQPVDQGLEKVLRSFEMLRNNRILGAPMHLYMLTEIFIDDPQASMEKVLVLTDIFRYFIITKYQRYLTKACYGCLNPIVEDGIYYRNEQYKLAAITCLNSVKFNVHCNVNFLRQIGKIGDVVGVIFKVNPDGTIIFSQQTFADYFAALWFVDNYQNIENIKSLEYLEELKSIWYMFNLEMCKNHPAHLAVLSLNFEELQKNQNRVQELDFLNRSTLHLSCAYGTKLPNLQISEGKLIGSKEAVTENAANKQILDYLIDGVKVDPLQPVGIFQWNLFDCAFNKLNLYAMEKLLLTYPQHIDVALKSLEVNQNYWITVIYFSVKFGYQNLIQLMSQTFIFPAVLSAENCRGEHLLYVAVQSGNSEIVETLLDNGARIDAVTSSYNRRSALHLAVERNDLEVVELLLQRGASVDLMDRYRNTPLHLASSKGCFESVKILLKFGSDINFADNFGRTSLQLAASYGHSRILKLLVDHGARFDCDRFGNSAISCAREEEIVQILENAPSTSFSIRL